MNADKISKLINDASVELICLEQIDSTNLYLKRMLDSGTVSRAVCIARAQTKGMGRSGKSFFSPQETGLYMSVMLHPKAAFGDVPGITAKVCVAVARSIESVCGIRCGIKWVNDLYFNSKKVCGILCQAVNDYSQKTVESVIIGIGINLSTAYFPDELKDIAGSLSVDINVFDELAGNISKAVLGLKFGALLPDELEYYRQNSCIIGKEIDYYINSQMFSAVAVGIDSDGGLIIKQNDGSFTTLTSGEITVRFS